MPGAYLLAILVSAGGIAVIDARWKLAAWKSNGGPNAFVANVCLVLTQRSEPGSPRTVRDPTERTAELSRHSPGTGA